MATVFGDFLTILGDIKLASFLQPTLWYFFQPSLTKPNLVLPEKIFAKML
jgi:hypothetical protein